MILTRRNNVPDDIFHETWDMIRCADYYCLCHNIGRVCNYLMGKGYRIELHVGWRIEILTLKDWISETMKSYDEQGRKRFVKYLKKQNVDENLYKEYIEV